MDIGSFVVLLLIFVLVTGVFGWFFKFILKSRAKDQSKGTFEKMYEKEED